MIQETINELVDSDKSLVNPLLKIKVLATRLNSQELLYWVNHELNGYNDVAYEGVPSYRIAKAFSSCTLQAGTIVLQNGTPVPITFLPEEFGKRMFLEFPLYEGVQALEHIERSEHDTLSKNLGIDFWKTVSDEVGKKGFPYSISNISIGTHKISVTQALSEIRTKFLDLLLELEKKLPNNADGSKLEAEEKEEVNQVITVVMKQINVMNTGDGAALNIGDDNNLNSAHGVDIEQQ